MRERRVQMDKKYSTPEVDVVKTDAQDVVSTSLSIELPWLPLEDDGKEI